MASEVSANGAASPPTDLESKIIQQIEFYFGDVNLQRDKFMLGEMKQNEGWIPMETMLKFNRLSKLSSDAAVIMKALQKSSSDLMQIDEKGAKIRRAKPLPENSLEYWKGKGFPQDYDLAQLEKVLHPLGRCDHIIMRRTKAPERIFKKKFENRRNDYHKEKQMSVREKRLKEKQEKRKRQADKLKYTKGLIMRLDLPEALVEEEERQVVDKIKKAIESITAVRPAWIDLCKDTKTALLRFNGPENEACRVLAKLHKGSAGEPSSAKADADKKDEVGEKKDSDGDKKDAAADEKAAEKPDSTAETAAAAASLQSGEVQLCGHKLAATVLQGDDEAAYHVKQERERTERKFQRAKDKKKKEQEFKKAKRERQANRKRKADDDGGKEADEPAKNGGPSAPKKIVFSDHDDSGSDEQAADAEQGDREMDASGEQEAQQDGETTDAKHQVGMHSEDSDSDDDKPKDKST